MTFGSLFSYSYPKGVFATNYITSPPDENHKHLLKGILKILNEHKINLLSCEELNEEVPHMEGVRNPEDSAKVEDLLFADEYH